MQHNALSIRPFLGAKNFEESRRFYSDLGFEETIIDSNLSVFKTGIVSFYLQKAFVKDWIDNTMVFLEVEDVDSYYKELVGLNLPAKYPTAKVSPIRIFEWGKECFVHDPSGILWHIGQFAKE